MSPVLILLGVAVSACAGVGSWLLVRGASRRRRPGAPPPDRDGAAPPVLPVGRISELLDRPGDPGRWGFYGLAYAALAEADPSVVGLDGIRVRELARAGPRRSASLAVSLLVAGDRLRQVRLELVAEGDGPFRPVRVEAQGERPIPPLRPYDAETRLRAVPGLPVQAGLAERLEALGPAARLEAAAAVRAVLRARLATWRGEAPGSARPGELMEAREAAWTRAQAAAGVVRRARAFRLVRLAPVRVDGDELVLQSVLVGDEQVLGPDGLAMFGRPDEPTLVAEYWTVRRDGAGARVLWSEPEEALRAAEPGMAWELPPAGRVPPPRVAVDDRVEGTGPSVLGPLQSGRRFAEAMLKFRRGQEAQMARLEQDAKDRMAALVAEAQARDHQPAESLVARRRAEPGFDRLGAPPPPPRAPAGRGRVPRPYYDPELLEAEGGLGAEPALAPEALAAWFRAVAGALGAGARPEHGACLAPALAALVAEAPEPPWPAGAPSWVELVRVERGPGGEPTLTWLVAGRLGPAAGEAVDPARRADQARAAELFGADAVGADEAEAPGPWVAAYWTARLGPDGLRLARHETPDGYVG